MLRGLSLPLHKELQVPDQNVDVTFDRTSTPNFAFDCDAVRMTAAGKVILHKMPPNAPWEFTGGRMADDPLEQFTFAVRGKQLHINDECKDRKEDGPKSYCYMVTVKDNVGLVESPDPVIVNDPGARLEEQS